MIRIFNVVKDTYPDYGTWFTKRCGGECDSCGYRFRCFTQKDTISWFFCSDFVKLGVNGEDGESQQSVKLPP